MRPRALPLFIYSSETVDDANYTKIRGAARGNQVNPGDPVDPILDALFSSDVRVGRRVYPGWYAASLGRFKPNRLDVERMRRAIGGIPRVDPQLYDILFNSETREWVIVKWSADLDIIGYVGRSFVYEMIERPIEVYEIDARRRGPSSLSEKDWLHLRAHCVTLHDARAISKRTFDAQNKVKLDRATEIGDQEHDMLSYHHQMFRKLGEESGMAFATPAEMAAKFGGSAHDWDPDYIPGMERR